MLAQGPGGQRLHQAGSRSRTCEGRWAQLVPGGTGATATSGGASALLSERSQRHEDMTGAVPAPSPRPSFAAPAALWGPRALHTDRLPPFRAGAAPSAQPGALCRARPSHTRSCGGSHRGGVGHGGHQGSDLGQDQPMGEGGGGAAGLAGTPFLLTLPVPLHPRRLPEPQPSPGRAKPSYGSQAGHSG